MVEPHTPHLGQKFRSFLQLGLEVKSKPVEELTEVADVVEIVDEDEQIQQEVRKYTTFP